MAAATPAIGLAHPTVVPRNHEQRAATDDEAADLDGS
jgi:hypothetical protein